MNCDNVNTKVGLVGAAPPGSTEIQLPDCLSSETMHTETWGRAFEVWKPKLDKMIVLTDKSF